MELRLRMVMDCVSAAESRKTGLIDNFWMKRRNFTKYERYEERPYKDEKQSGFKGEISTKDKVSKRTRINEYFPVTPQFEQDQPPQTPPHRIFSCGALSDASVPFWIQQSCNERSIEQEFSGLDSICSNFDHEKVSSQTIGQMQNYEVDIENTYLQLSQENSQIVPEEIRKIIEKMKGIKYRLFDYRIINLSERNVTNPVNKLSKSEKRILKDIWNSTIRLDKWENTIEDVLEKPYVRPFIHREHHDLLWVQDIYKRFLFLFDAYTNLLLDPDQSELSYRENFVNPIVVKVFDDIMDLIK
ncbi:14151_t:CDS:2, partial [Funneliformis mosseae]